MVFEEPKLEVVQLDTKDIFTAVSCNLETTSQQGSGEDCVNCDANQNNCEKLGLGIMDDNVK